MKKNNNQSGLDLLLGSPPSASAKIAGSDRYPEIRGAVKFYRNKHGVLVCATISGLPESADPCACPIFGFHIHEGANCTGNPDDPFADTGAHYNPHGCLHPYHSGDLPPLFGVKGHAFSVFLTDRFTVDEIIDRTVIVHAMPDDFTTQPSGNAGMKIACGKIKKRPTGGMR